MNLNTFFIDSLAGSTANLVSNTKKNLSGSFGFSDIIKVCEDDLASVNGKATIEEESLIGENSFVVENTMPLSSEELSKLIATINAFENSGANSSPSINSFRLGSANVTKKQFLLNQQSLGLFVQSIIAPFDKTGVKDSLKNSVDKPIDASVLFKENSSKIKVNITSIKQVDPSDPLVLEKLFEVIKPFIASSRINETIKNDNEISGYFETDSEESTNSEVSFQQIPLIEDLSKDLNEQANFFKAEVIYFNVPFEIATNPLSNTGIESQPITTSMANASEITPKLEWISKSQQPNLIAKSNGTFTIPNIGYENSSTVSSKVVENLLVNLANDSKSIEVPEPNSQGVEIRTNFKIDKGSSELSANQVELNKLLKDLGAEKVIFERKNTPTATELPDKSILKNVQSNTLAQEINKYSSQINSALSQSKMVENPSLVNLAVEDSKEAPIEKLVELQQKTYVKLLSKPTSVSIEANNSNVKIASNESINSKSAIQDTEAISKSTVEINELNKEKVDVQVSKPDLLSKGLAVENSKRNNAEVKLEMNNSKYQIDSKNIANLKNVTPEEKLNLKSENNIQANTTNSNNATDSEISTVNFSKENKVGINISSESELKTSNEAVKTINTNATPDIEKNKISVSKENFDKGSINTKQEQKENINEAGNTNAKAKEADEKIVVKNDNAKEVKAFNAKATIEPEKNKITFAEVKEAVQNKEQVKAEAERHVELKENLLPSEKADTNHSDSKESGKSLHRGEIDAMTMNSNTNTVDNSFEKIKQSAEAKLFNEPFKVVKQHEVMNEFSKLIQEGQKQTMTLQLSPESMGKVRLIVDMVENQIVTRIEVENESVKQFMQSNIEQLKQNLVSSGINLGSVNVSLADYDQKNSKNGLTKKKSSAKFEKEIVENASIEPKIKNFGYNTYEYLA